MNPFFFLSHSLPISLFFCLKIGNQISIGFNFVQYWKGNNNNKNRKFVVFSLFPNFPSLSIFYIFTDFLLHFMYWWMVFTHFFSTNILTDKYTLNCIQCMYVCAYMYMRVCVCMRVWYKRSLFTKFHTAYVHKHWTWIKRPT